MAYPPVTAPMQGNALQRILAGLPGLGMKAAVSGQPAPGAQPAPRPMVVQANPADASLAKALLQGAYANEPIETPIEGIGRLAQAWSGQKLERDYQDKENNKYSELVRALSGASTPQDAARIMLESGDPKFIGTGLDLKFKPPATDAWEVVKGDDGKFYKTNKKGEVMPTGVGGPKPETANTRKTAKDANGIERYVDTGEKVFANSPDKPPPDFKDVTTLRKEIQDLPAYKSYELAMPAYNSIIESLDNDSRAGDLDFVYALARIFDPNSVVREGEMILVNKTQSLPDQVIGALNGVVGGQRLTPESRAALAKVASTRMAQYDKALTGHIDQFRGIAERHGLDTADILPNLVKAKPVPAAPGGGLAVPEGAIEALRAAPERAPEFDAKYGPGAAAKILGTK